MNRQLPSYRNRVRVALGIFLCCLIGITYVFVDVLAGSFLLDGRERALAQAAQNVAQHLEEDISDVLRDLTLASRPMGIPVAAPEDIGRINKARLDASRNLLPGYAWIATANLDGVIVSATDDSLVGLDVGDQAWFFRGRGATALIDAVGERFQSPTPPRIAALSQFLEISTPVRGRDGRPVAVIAAGIKLEWLLNSQKLGLGPIAHLPGVELLIASWDGRVLAGRSSEVGKVDNSLGDPSAFVARTATGGTLGYLPSLGWQVIVRQPRADALSALHRFRLLALAGIALIGLMALALGEWITRSFATPFETLAVAAAAFKNDPTRHVLLPPATTREVVGLTDALSDAFDSVRRSEKVLRRSNDDLERQVAERTQELVAARDKAQAATIAKGEFLATMSHEIRSPLGSIVGLTDLLLEDPTIAGRQRGRLELIQSASSGLTALVNDVLDFSKIETDAVELCERPFDLHRLLETCCGLIQVQSDRKGVTLVRDWLDDLPPVMGDELRLRQVVTNLLSNAVKFTQEGSVTLRLRREYGAGDQIRIDVSDTGVGIPPEKIDRLFKRYSQADASVQGEFGGTGLGLAISQRLVALMGGRIEVGSVLGQGTTFSFAVALPEAGWSGDEEAPAPTPAVESLEVLLADDLVANQDFIGAMLRAEGHHVQIASDGLEAVDCASRTAFDIILLDIQMPGLDGIAAARAIRQGSGPNATRRIVALTANTSAEHVRQFRDAGMDAHVAKPVVRRELMAALDTGSGSLASGAATPSRRRTLAA